MAQGCARLAGFGEFCHHVEGSSGLSPSALRSSRTWGRTDPGCPRLNTSVAEACPASEFRRSCEINFLMEIYLLVIFK